MEQLTWFELVPRIILIDFMRYFVTAALAYFLFWIAFKRYWQHRIIQQKPFKARKMWSEFAYSMSTVLVFATIGTGILLAKKAGYTQIYDDFGAGGGWPWFGISLAVMIFLHDTYFYWTHRLMHHPRIFRHVHLVHHRSTNPSPWAAYAFHPFEAVISALIYVIFVFTIPLHGLALFALLLYMIVRNVLGHLGIEFLPKGFVKNRWLNWHSTTTHHDLHHKDFGHNFGLYFTFWDKLCGTEHPAYHAKFEEVTSRKRDDLKPRPATPSSKLVGLVLFLGLFIFSQNMLAQTPLGKWKTIDDGDGEARSLVEITATDGVLSGKILEIYPRSCDIPDPVCDRCAGERKNAKIAGMTFLWGLQKVGDEWKNGAILDPANGTVYRAKIWLENDKTLKVRGYWGIFWRTQTWYRVE